MKVSYFIYIQRYRLNPRVKCNFDFAWSWKHVLTQTFDYENQKIMRKTIKRLADEFQTPKIKIQRSAKGIRGFYGIERFNVSDFDG